MSDSGAEFLNLGRYCFPGSVISRSFGLFCCRFGVTLGYFGLFYFE